MVIGKQDGPSGLWLPRTLPLSRRFCGPYAHQTLRPPCPHQPEQCRVPRNLLPQAVRASSLALSPVPSEVTGRQVRSLPARRSLPTSVWGRGLGGGQGLGAQIPSVWSAGFESLLWNFIIASYST